MIDELEDLHMSKVRSGRWRPIGNKHRRRKLRKRGESVRWSEYVGWYWIPDEPLRRKA